MLLSDVTIIQWHATYDIGIIQKTHAKYVLSLRSTLSGLVSLKKQKHKIFNRNVILYASEKYSHQRMYCRLHNFMYQNQCGSWFGLFFHNLSSIEQCMKVERWKQSKIEDISTSQSQQKNFRNLFADDALNTISPMNWHVCCVIKISANMKRKIWKWKNELCQCTMTSK